METSKAATSAWAIEIDKQPGRIQIEEYKSISSTAKKQAINEKSARSHLHDSGRFPKVSQKTSNEAAVRTSKIRCLQLVPLE